jgi:hypothetical protein
MIQVVIFSYDRAMQLDLLLRSIKKFDTQRIFSISVLFACSSEAYQTAYDRLKNNYPDIHWIQEQCYAKLRINYQFDFAYWHNLYWWLKNSIFRKNKSNFKSCLLELLAGTEYPFTMFLTDDSLFYNPVIISESCMEKIKRQPEKYSFSFRHGMHLQGGVYRKQTGYIDWNTFENDVKTDWGYPFSVDGHVYDSRTVYWIINKILLNNPNTMEGNIACYVTEKKLFPTIMAPKQSSLVGFELNRVQSVSANHHWGISPEKLKQYYLDDYVLETDFDSSNVDYFRPKIQSLFVKKGNKKIELWNP